jgi:hypothetical protein
MNILKDKQTLKKKTFTMKAVNTPFPSIQGGFRHINSNYFGSYSSTY